MVAWGASLNICVWPTGGFPRLTQPRQLSTGASEAMPVSAACAMWPCKDPLLLCRQLSLQQAPARPRVQCSQWAELRLRLGEMGQRFWIPSRPSLPSYGWMVVR